MSEDWNTKYGTRRVRRDPPTLEEAIFAAVGITDDQQQQAEIAAALMGLPYEDVLAEVKKTGRAVARSATRITSESRRRISSFRRPTALSSLSPRKELLQTSSARRSVWWTAVGTIGRISCSTTGTPRFAACHAASLPARPPPMM